ncbi:porphobilinogen synthase [Roseospirillum parvum]|uniref:Delta-aminolevulinic acid dehydratase n=1 Tax=Roseospirillum parvum TaxID=83401 RepID=A0A1G7Y489_9PROT|nr:porphobilinogen synthase [Roseospirillum parvum]SDG91298.1 porphobilinogen synthase [Roseospirillum parvum]
MGTHSNFAAFPGRYPATRLRRNRHDDWTRRLVAENTLTVNDLIWPVFVVEGTDQTQEVASMPGVRRFSVDRLSEAVGRAVELGIPAISLFPSIDPALKTPDGREASNPDNLVCRAVREIKAAHPQIGIMCDVALDPFNSDGHDGVVVDGYVANDLTVEMLIRQAVNQARAGCDLLGPSDMMDGRIGAIRQGLDEAGFQHVRLISYAAKYASAFYGPFRDAIGSGGALKGDKKTYQMNPANSDEALRECALDVAEGADMLMVKPGLPYLDIIRRVKETFGLPTTAYQVSGEYAMIRAAADNGWLDGEAAAMESLMAFKRAGADAVLTYFALDVAQRLKTG